MNNPNFDSENPASAFSRKKDCFKEQEQSPAPRRRRPWDFPGFRKIALCLLLFQIYLAPVFSLTESSPRQLFVSGRYAETISALDSIETAEPAYFEENGLRYLRGVAKYRMRKFSSAGADLFGVGSSSDALGTHGLRRMSAIFRSTGNLAVEELLLTECLLKGDNPEFAAFDSLRTAESAIESQNFKAVSNRLSEGFAFATGESADDRRENELRLGRVLHFAGEMEKAGPVLEELLSNAPKGGAPDDISLEAAKLLDVSSVGIDNFRKKVPKLHPDQHFLRATVYQSNRDFEAARLHYEEFSSASAEDKRRPLALLEIARGHDQRREYKEAIIAYERVEKEFSDSPEMESATYGKAGAQAALGDTANAVANYEIYIRRNENARNLERAYMNIADAYRDAGKNVEAIKWCELASERFKGKRGEAVARFEKARILLSEEKHVEAAETLSKLLELQDLGGTSVAGGTSRQEAGFLLALARLKSGEKDSLEKFLESDLAPTGYFRERAIALRDGSKSKQDEKRSTPDGETDLPNTSDISGIPQRLQMLGDLGLLEEFVPAFANSLLAGINEADSAVLQRDSASTALIAKLSASAGFADFGIRHLKSGLEKSDSALLSRLSPDESRVLFPAPFRNHVLEFSRKEKIDPRFLLSIMRQESQFKADVKSSAAARGLMQFVSGTSNQIALELKLEGFRQDDLYSPRVAVMMGARYLGNLFRLFPGKPEAVAAAYNGGEDRVARWLKRANTSDPDIYFSEIVFSQTKDYVARVMENYRVYRQLYDQDLEPLAIPKSSRNSMEQ
ncbi:MAG: transglycosylase SLT domain-containing protein [Pyrinomonadaceae bacterium]